MVDEVVVELRENSTVEETTVLDDGDKLDVEDESEDEGPRRPIELLSRSEIATIKFRFAVGDIVMCSVDKGEQEGTVRKRCYREKGWPSGRYAAVRD